ncbi:hypothetical protein F2P81_006021 [Scophthalmus maximus]|uniref:Retrotransposon gag domain-containing protein n=1 Tax=Scophthalmus maximus TaxID=52904 RepID=A0A6A4TC96_SCOMX|nr:hypothetical protein F2P81_006021 [Scophthalmus maximus]
MNVRWNERVAAAAAAAAAAGDSDTATVSTATPRKEARRQIFAAEIRKVFRMPLDASGGLLRLHQGSHSMVDYAIDFHTQALMSEGNKPAQVDAFLLGLASYAKDELVSHDLPSSLDDIIELVSRIDRCIQARRRGRRSDHLPASRPSALPRPPSPPAGQPMREEVLLFICPSSQTSSNFLLACMPFMDKGERRTGGKKRKRGGISVPTTLREGYCLRAYPGRDAEGLNLPEPIHSDRERDLRETRTTKTVCDKAEAPQSERSEIKCDIFHLFVNASLAAHSLETTVGLLPS